MVVTGLAVMLGNGLAVMLGNGLKMGQAMCLKSFWFVFVGGVYQYAGFIVFKPW